MPRMLAVDWDRHEARYVLATAAGETLQIRAAASAPLVDVVEGGGEPQPDLGHSLRAALAREKVGRAVTLVGVDRGSVELLHFTLPPATDAELPELVLNQAIRDSSSIDEDSALDFLPLGEDPAQPRRVTAAALVPERLEQITATCAEAGLKPRRILLRPYASASLFSRAGPGRERICLLVSLVADEVDLTVLVEGKAVFSRTVLLPHFATEPQATQRVSAEIKRTLAVAVQSQLGSDAVESVYIFGGPGEHQELIDRIREEVSLPAVVFNPFEAADVSAAQVPDRPGRFAALLGMLLDEARGGRHALDFLHPRQPPKRISRRQIITMTSAAVAAVILVAGYFAWSTLAAADRTNRQLLQELRDLDHLVKATAEERKIVDAVRDWQAGDVLWLEELRELSERFPPDEDAVILRMSMASARSGGGVIDVKGLVNHSSVLLRMENALRDRYHDVYPKGSQKTGREEDYTWHFDTSVFVSRRDKSQYLRDRLQRPDESQ